MNNFKYLSALLVSALLVACSGTKTVGTKVTEDIAPISHLSIVANDQTNFGGNSALSNRGAGDSMNRFTAKIFTKLEERLPIIFALNGVSGNVQLRSKPDLTKNNTGKPTSHVMTLSPTQASLKGGGDFSVLMISSLTDVNSKKLNWKGETRYSANGLVAVTDTSADEFAKALLIQLKKDGVISFPTAEPVMPK